MWRRHGRHCCYDEKMGWQVTGSDKGFFPPISDFLKKHQIDFYPGWHPEKMNQPDIVVVGNFISLKNPEYLLAKEKDLTIKSYPEIVAQYIIKKNYHCCCWNLW